MKNRSKTKTKTKIKVPQGITRAINRFEAAVENNAFKGTIPYGESELAAMAYEAVEQEYEHARHLLEKAILRHVVRAIEITRDKVKVK